MQEDQSGVPAIKLFLLTSTVVKDDYLTIMIGMSMSGPYVRVSPIIYVNGDCFMMPRSQVFIILTTF